MPQCSRATLRKFALIGCINQPVLVDIPRCRDCDVATGRRRTHNRHSRDGGNPRRGGRRWIPLSTGTTVGGGAPTIVIPATAGIHDGGPAMGSVSTGTTVVGGAHTIVIPATAGIHTGGRRWVPVSTGTTGGGGAPTIDGGRRAHPTIVIPATAGIHGPKSSFPRRRESTTAGPAMGSRLHRNYGGRRAHPNRHSLRRRESTTAGRRWVPVSTETTGGGGAPTIVIPATAGIHRGGPAMGSRLHRNDGRRRRTHNRHSRDGGNPQRGPAFLSAAPNRYRGGRGRARRRTCDTMTSAGIDGRSTRRRPAAPTLVGSMQPAAQRTCQS